MIIKIITLLLLVLPAPCYAFGPAIQAVLGTSSVAGSTCGTSEIVPTYTTLSTDWTVYPSGTALDAINELIAGRNAGDFVYIPDSTKSNLIFRVSLPGDCDVSSIRVETFADSNAASVTADVSISNDDSTYTSTQSIALAVGTPTAAPKTFSSLSWTTPTYCYVKYIPTSTQYQNVRIYAVSITVSP